MWGVVGGVPGAMWWLCSARSVLLACSFGFVSLLPTYESISSTPCFFTVLCWQVPGGGLCLGCHGDFLAAEEIAALLFCHLKDTYIIPCPPIFQCYLPIGWLRDLHYSSIKKLSKPVSYTHICNKCKMTKQRMGYLQVEWLGLQQLEESNRHNRNKQVKTADRQVFIVWNRALQLVLKASHSVEALY